MRLIACRQLRDFYESPAHRTAEQPLRTWKAVVRGAVWRQPSDVKQTFPQTDILKSGRAVFDIGGNKWRMVAGIDYVSGIVFIKFVGTHAQYDEIDAHLVQDATMDPRIIKTEVEHDAVLAEIDRLMALGVLSEAERGSLELLALLSETYEEHCPIDLPDPIEAIRLRMLDLGLEAADLADVMGGGERAVEVLDRRSPLTLPMVRGLASRLGLPVDVLVQDYEVASRAA